MFNPKNSEKRKTRMPESKAEQYVLGAAISTFRSEQEELFRRMIHHAKVGEVHQRMTDGGELPIKYGRHTTSCLIAVHDVVQGVIPVYDTSCVVNVRKLLVQPTNQLVYFGPLLRLCRHVLLCPGLQLLE